MLVAEASKAGSHMCSVYTTLELAKSAALERHQKHLDENWRDKSPAGASTVDADREQHMAERPIANPVWEEIDYGIAMNPIVGHSQQTRGWSFLDEDIDAKYSIREEELRE
jgi:hypothetical protein